MSLSLTYLQFHLVFTLPVLAVLWYLAPRYDQVRRRRATAGLVIMVTVAFAYTTPWGSYMIGRGVWWYGENAVFARALDIPLGEYMFFIIQTLLVGLYLHWRGFDPSFESGDLAPGPRLAGIAAGVALSAGGLGLAVLADSGLYLGGLVAWTGPVVALQWAVGGGYLVRRPRMWLESAVVPAVYLWAADWTAIQMGTWSISAEFTTGTAPLGLPVEEMLFFLAAGVMTSTGLVLWEWALDWSDSTGRLRALVPEDLSARPSGQAEELSEPDSRA